MGLDIRSQSDIEYSESYSTLHRIRYVAYQAQGGKKEYADWHNMHSRSVEPDWEYADCLLLYPNLYWHSDCDGIFTPRGKLDFSMGQTGNSRRLLWELKDIREELVKNNWKNVVLHDCNSFDRFHDLVKDVVENHNGRLEFV